MYALAGGLCLFACYFFGWVWSDDGGGGGKQSTISKERKVTYTKNYSQSTTLNSLSVKTQDLIRIVVVFARFQVILWFCFKSIDIFNCYREISCFINKMSPIFMQYYYWKRAFVFMLRCDSWQYLVQETSRLSNIKQMFCIKQCWPLSLV